MISKYIIFFIVMLLPISINAEPNKVQVDILRHEANNGDSYSMYRLGKILYENGDAKEGMRLLVKACSEYKEKYACEYINNISPNTLNTTLNTSTLDKREIFCEYTDVKDKPMGVSAASRGVTTGIPWLDGLNTIVGLIDDARDYFHTHTYICSYAPIREGQDAKFKEDIDHKDIKYIIFFNGALKNYYKLYSTHQVKENTIYPKARVDYVGIIDKNNNLLRLDSVKDNKIYPWTAADLPKLKNYKLEE